VKKLQKDMKKKVLIQLLRNDLKENAYASSGETGFLGVRLDWKAVHLRNGMQGLSKKPFTKFTESVRKITHVELMPR
jgi:hypothetical protein